MRNILFAMFIAALFSCSSEKKDSKPLTAEKPMIAVVNYPLYYFTKQIVGNLATVYFPNIDGDPAFWQPDSKQLSNFQKADLIIDNGADYAKWIKKVSLPTSKIMDASSSFSDHLIETHEGVVHSHGPEGEHSHKGVAFTTWLDFKLGMKQAQAIREAVLKLMPEKKETINQGFERLRAQLEKLDSNMASAAKAFEDAVLAGSHPVYQYLAKGYNLQIECEHWEPNLMPSGHDWEHFEEKIDKKQIKIMLWESDPTQEIKQKLDQLNIRYMVFNPCGNRTDDAGFYEVMAKNIEELQHISL